MSSVREDVREMHGGCRGLMGVSDLSKTECINQLATAGTGESAEIYPQ